MAKQPRETVNVFYCLTPANCGRGRKFQRVACFPSEKRARAVLEVRLRKPCDETSVIERVQMNRAYKWRETWSEIK